MLWFAGLFTFDIAVIFLFTLARFVPAWGNLNWQGKLLEDAWPLVLAAGYVALFVPEVEEGL